MFLIKTPSYLVVCQRTLEGAVQQIEYTNRLLNAPELSTTVRNVATIYFGGVRSALRKFCTANFALLNGKFSRMGWLTSYTPLTFVSASNSPSARLYECAKELQAVLANSWSCGSSILP